MIYPTLVDDVAKICLSALLVPDINKAPSLISKDYTLLASLPDHFLSVTFTTGDAIIVVIYLVGLPFSPISHHHGLFV